MNIICRFYSIRSSLIKVIVVACLFLTSISGLSAHRPKTYEGLWINFLTGGGLSLVSRNLELIDGTIMQSTVSAPSVLGNFTIGRSVITNLFLHLGVSYLYSFSSIVNNIEPPLGETDPETNYLYQAHLYSINVGFTGFISCWYGTYIKLELRTAPSAIFSIDLDDGVSEIFETESGRTMGLGMAITLGIDFWVSHGFSIGIAAYASLDFMRLARQSFSASLEDELVPVPPIELEDPRFRTFRNVFFGGGISMSLF